MVKLQVTTMQTNYKSFAQQEILKKIQNSLKGFLNHLNRHQIIGGNHKKEPKQISSDLKG